MRIPVQDDILCAGVVVALVTGVGMLAKMTRNDRANAPQMLRAAKDLMSQSIQWMDMCTSHTETAYKLQAATLATAYCNAARTVASDDELARSLNIDVHDKLRAMETMQRKTLIRLQKDAVVTRGPTAKAVGEAIGTSINWM